MPRDDVFTRWQEGDATPAEALRALLSDLDEVTDVRKRAEAAESDLRAKLSEVVAALGGRAEHGGTKLALTAPSVRRSFDARALERLGLELEVTHPDIAQRLFEARRETMQAGSLRIERRKERE